MHVTVQTLLFRFSPAATPQYRTQYNPGPAPNANADYQPPPGALSAAAMVAAAATATATATATASMMVHQDQPQPGYHRQASQPPHGSQVAPSLTTSQTLDFHI